MKKITLIFVAVISTILLFAQSPQAFKYQAVVRDNLGAIVANQEVSFRFSIRDEIPIGDILYQEVQLEFTDAYGRANLEIGRGAETIGVFEDIDWGDDERYLEVELDLEGGSAFVSMGTTQLLAVPYALYAESTGDTSRWKKINNDLYYNNGNIGIGTNDPKSWAKLDVVGGLSVEGPAYINHSDATESILDIFNSVSDWELVGASDANRFDVRKWGDIPALSITENYNVGLRNTNPFVDLDIRSNGPDVASRLLLGNSDNSSNIFLNGGTDIGNPYISYRGGDALLFGRYDGGYNEIMRLQSDGYVGIGTSVPTQMLEVTDTIYSSIGGFKFPDGTVQVTGSVGNTLNQAYNQGGTGAGRTITANSGAVNIAGNDGLTVNTSVVIGDDVSYDGGLLVNGNVTANHNINGGYNYAITGYAFYGDENYGITGAAMLGLYSVGVWGGAYDSDDNYGVIGHVDTPTADEDIAIYGLTNSTTTDYAGYFHGNVYITGSSTKSIGVIKIDHPLDPENKYLCHSSVESSDMMNVYNGNVLLDLNGEAWVEMPDWFDALNKDFRYQLTAIGQPAPNLFISEKLLNNQFKIAGGKPEMEVSWQITGIRNDKLAQGHRIIVEKDKPVKDRGAYLHPQAYGLDVSRGIGYERIKKFNGQNQINKGE